MCSEEKKLIDAFWPMDAREGSFNVRLIGVLHELVHRQSCVVGLDNGVRHLGGWHDRERVHDAVGVLLTDLGDQESAQTGAGTATERVGELEALEAVTALGLLADNVEDAVNELGTLGVVSLGPVVTSTRLSEDEVVGAEDLAERARADRVLWRERLMECR